MSLKEQHRDRVKELCLQAGIADAVLSDLPMYKGLMLSIGDEHAMAATISTANPDAVDFRLRMMVETLAKRLQRTPERP